MNGLAREKGGASTHSTLVKALVHLEVHEKVARWNVVAARGHFLVHLEV